MNRFLLIGSTFPTNNVEVGIGESIETIADRINFGFVGGLPLDGETVLDKGFDERFKTEHSFRSLPLLLLLLFPQH